MVDFVAFFRLVIATFCVFRKAVALIYSDIAFKSSPSSSEFNPSISSFEEGDKKTLFVEEDEAAQVPPIGAGGSAGVKRSAGAVRSAAVRSAEAVRFAAGRYAGAGSTTEALNEAG